MIKPIRQLYRYRALISVLIQRELKAKYRGTALGLLWSLINPLVLTAIYLLVFSVYMRVGMENYPAFLLSGILPWTWFSMGLSESAHSIISNGGLIKKVYLPSEIFPFVSIGSNMVHYLFSLPILIFLLFLMGLKLSWLLLFLPIVLGIQFVLSYGIALILASLAVQFRDLLHILPNLLMMGLFLTPIFYPMTMIPEKYRLLVQVNPMAHLMKLYQDIFFYHQMLSPWSLGILVGLSSISLWVGLSFFEARKDWFAEEV